MPGPESAVNDDTLYAIRASAKNPQYAKFEDAEVMRRRYGADASLEEKAHFLTEKLIALEQVKGWKLMVKKELSKPEFLMKQSKDFRSLVPTSNPLLYSMLEKMEIMSALKRAIITLHCDATQAAAPASVLNDSKREDVFLTPEMEACHGCHLDMVKTAKENWEKITREEMMRLANELGKPFVAPAVSLLTADLPTNLNAEDVDDIAHIKAVDEGNGKTDGKRIKIGSIRFLYDRQDLLHALQAIKPNNRAAEDSGSDAWGSIQLQFYTPPFLEYRQRFAELAPAIGQIGVDELFPIERQVFLSEKNRVGDVVLTHHSTPMARQYAKTGCPTNIRSRIWLQALSVFVTSEARAYFEMLKDQVTHWAYLTDAMYMLDLQQTVDTCDYFVFQDLLESVVMAFTRDSYVQQHAPQVNGTIHTAVDDTSSSLNPSVYIPPNGVLPFSGLVMYVAPLTYLYNDEVELYFVFRIMYIQYWSKLNAIRTEPSTILPLCKLFEDLVVRSSPTTVFHLISVGIKPLNIAFPWIQSAFSGVIEIDQVLLLWDRVIGYDSLELIPLFAAALFHFRSEELETVTSMNEVDELFAELIEVQVIPLLHEYLFLLS